MNIEDLPTEILQRIFKKLRYQELLPCREVSRRWQAIAGGMAEDRCKMACMRDFPEAYAEARRKSQYKLTWADLHKSLSLWPLINNPQTTQRLYCTPVLQHYFCAMNRPRHFYVLNNGLIGCPVYTGDREIDKFCGHWDTILYFNIDTLQEHHRTQYDFTFTSYEENDDIIAFRDDKLKLRIVAKSTGSILEAGEMKQQEWGDYSEFYVVRNSVYFRAKDDTIWVAKLCERDGEMAVTSQPLAQFDKHDIYCELDIQTMAYVDENQVNVLTIRGRIYSLTSEHGFQYLDRVKKNMDNRTEVVTKLAQYGFDWSDRKVYEWIDGSDLINNDWVAVTKVKKAILHRQGTILVIGTIIRTLHIYVNPYGRNGELKLFTAQPKKKVDLRELFEVNPDQPTEYKRISQIDIVETHSGHKIIILVAQRIVILEFTHKKDIVHNNYSRFTNVNIDGSFNSPSRKRKLS